MKIPFTKYEVKINKRGIKVKVGNKLVSFVDWAKGFSVIHTTPILEEFYTSMAKEFAKIDLMHITEKDNQYQRLSDNLNYIVSMRPNKLQTKYDFLFTLMYQYLKFGHFLAFIERDEKGHVVSINPINVEDYQFGNGYQLDEDGLILFKFKNKKTNEVEIIDYNNLIHLRNNPNDIFYGDVCSSLDNEKTLINLVDTSLSSLIAGLKENGKIRGVVKVGNSASGLNQTLMGKEKTSKKQKELTDRIKSARETGVFPLDAGEDFQEIKNPFELVSTSEIDKYIDMLLEFKGYNRQMVNGTADYKVMDANFQKNIMPVIDQFISELNYKIFTDSQITRGHRIDYYRNPFEYLPMDKAIDVGYKAIQDTTTNERRRMLYKLPPIEGGDVLLTNKNFEQVKKGNDYDED